MPARTKRAAVVVGGVVVNVVVADAQVDPPPPGAVLVDVTGRVSGIGWIYDVAGDVFTDPSPPAEEDDA